MWAVCGFYTEMAAILGPACWLPRWIQFLRPSAIGRMEFLASHCIVRGMLQKASELLPERECVVAGLAHGAGR